jgi:hypothetical protein
MRKPSLKMISAESHGLFPSFGKHRGTWIGQTVPFSFNRREGNVTINSNEGLFTTCSKYVDNNILRPYHFSMSGCENDHGRARCLSRNRERVAEPRTPQQTNHRNSLGPLPTSFTSHHRALPTVSVCYSLLRKKIFQSFQFSRLFPLLAWILFVPLSFVPWSFVIASS